MQTIVIVLNAAKLENPDLDIRYTLPERIEEHTGGIIKDNGYDYISNSELGLWLGSDDCEADAEKVIGLIRSEKFCGNDLSQTAGIYISEQDCAELSDCRKVYPTE